MADTANAKLRAQLIEKLTAIVTSTDGSQPLIINELHEFDPTAFEDVLLQLVHLSITVENADHRTYLRRFLLSLASRSMLLGLRLAWNIEAVTPGFNNAGLGNRVAGLQGLIESAAVNRSAPRSRLSSATSSEREGPTPEELQREVLQKEAREKVFNQEREFLRQLTNISGALVKIQDKSKRKAELHRLLEKMNDEFISCNRVFFPLVRTTDPVKWIVRICVKECAVFSSRERAPYLIVFETITDSATTSDPSLSTIDNIQGEARNPPHPYDPSTEEDPQPVKQESDGSPMAPEPVGLLTTVFGESMMEKRKRIREASEYGRHPGWSTEMVIVKAGDDLKQEELALQLIALFNTIWNDANLTLCVKPYGAISTNPDGGVIQCVSDASSIDGLKKAAGVQSLHQYFIGAYGGENSLAYNLAQRNFIESMAGYSVVCYILQIKDRHNGNLMVTRDGHLVHIDFGFMLATSPGGVNFERAPFKLSQELVDAMGGVNSSTFQYFKVLVLQGMMAVRERSKEILALIELMVPYNTLPCFGPDPLAVLNQVERRMRLDFTTEVEFSLYVRELISLSLDNWRTRRYDQFQTFQNGII